MTSRNQHYLRRAFSRKAAAFSAADFLHAELRDRLLERLQLFTLKPANILILGGGGGELAAALSQRYPQALCLSLDSSTGMCHMAATRSTAILADMIKLPCADDSIDMIVSNLSLQYCLDDQASLLPVFDEINRVLKPDGLFLASFAGNQSFPEWRAASANDGYSHLDPLPELHRAGDDMLKAGLCVPVLDSEPLTITYESFDRLIAEWRAVTASSCVQRRRLSLGGKHHWRRTRQQYEALRTAAGLLPLSLEIIYAHARGGLPPQRNIGDNEIGVPLARLLGRGPRKMDTDK